MELVLHSSKASFTQKASKNVRRGTQEWFLKSAGLEMRCNNGNNRKVMGQNLIIALVMAFDLYKLCCCSENDRIEFCFGSRHPLTQT